MKNWEPLVFLPALAIERRNGSECFTSKFSSRKKQKVLDVKCNNKKGRFAYTGEFRTVNGLSTGTVAVREIPTLDHELFFFGQRCQGKNTYLQEIQTYTWDNSMEVAPRIPKSMLTSGEFTEVTCRFWNLVIKKFENNTTGLLGVDGNIELSS